MFVVCLEDNQNNFTEDKIYEVLNTRENEYELQSDNNTKMWVSNRNFAQVSFVDFK